MTTLGNTVPRNMRTAFSGAVKCHRAQWQFQSSFRPSQLASLHSTSAQRRSNSSKNQNILRRMPKNAWDSHMHVTSPNYPLAANAAYTPSLHSIQHAMDFERTINVPNVVLVQPSIYGNDNSCLLDALRAIGPQHGRGVVGIDPETIDPGTLRDWHALGVRGVRLNLKSTNSQFTQQELKSMLRRYADVIRPFGWVLELFIGMAHIPMLSRAAHDLNVPICIAHFGAPSLPPLGQRTYPLDPYKLDGFRALVEMLQAEDMDTWVKLSAAYRFDEDPEMRGIEAVAKELLRVAPAKMVFASDWPHTRFEGLDVKPFVERCLEWTDEVGVTEKVFMRNAGRLWDVRS